MKQRILTILILFQVVLSTLGAGLFLVAKNSAYANTVAREAESLFEEAPKSLKELQSAGGEQLDYWAENLASFDGREFGYITPARNQYTKNTCWAFAAVGAAEASILREGIDKTATKENLDFDETIAAYTRHTREGDEDPLLLTANDKYDYGHWNQGDSAVNAFAVMTQGYTLLRENSFHPSVSDSDIRNKLAQSKYYVQSYQYIPSDINSIKRAILQYGAVTFNYSAPSKNKYYDKYASANHTSIIVGWDDTVDKSEFGPDKPEKDGAWIIKNSWGDSGFNQINGTWCYYISYDLPIGAICAVDLAMREDYQNIYYYDGNIGVSLKKYSADAQAAIYEAKLSSPTRQEQLKAVMISVPQENLNVNVRIYKNLKANPGNVNDKMNKPDQGEPVAELDTHIEQIGMHTIDLEEPINLEQGEYFSIVVGCKTQFNTSVPLNCAVESSASVNDMTYYLYNGEWISYKNSDNYADSSYINLSAKIRAVTNTVERVTGQENNLKYARAEIANRLVYYATDRQLVPDIQVYLDGKLLEYGQDYSVEVQDIDLPGMTAIEISGIGNYTGTRTTYFEVAKAKEPPGILYGTVDVLNDAINLYDVPIPPGWQWVDENKVLEYGAADSPVSLVYVGEDRDFYQKLTCEFYVNKINQDPPATFDISEAETEITGEYVYTGGQIIPNVKVTYGGKVLRNGVDCLLTFQNNVFAGTATVIVSGHYRYFGQTTQSFQIQKADSPAEKPASSIVIGRKIANINQVPLGCENWEWQTPNLEISADSIQATAVYTGEDRANYVNTLVQIAITREPPADIASIAELRLDAVSFVYDGQAKVPGVIAKDGEESLSQGADFDVEYKNNIFAGEASAIVKGKGDYTGTKILNFAIGQAEKPCVTDATIRYGKKAAKLSDIPLPSGFVWYDGDMEITENSLTAKAVYTGEDASSYKITELYFEIIIEEQEQPVKTDNGERGGLIWLAVVIPVSVLLVAGAVFVTVRHRRNTRGSQ